MYFTALLLPHSDAVTFTQQTMRSDSPDTQTNPQLMKTSGSVSYTHTHTHAQAHTHYNTGTIIPFISLTDFCVAKYRPLSYCCRDANWHGFEEEMGYVAQHNPDIKINCIC